MIINKKKFLSSVRGRRPKNKNRNGRRRERRRAARPGLKTRDTINDRIYMNYVLPKGLGDMWFELKAARGGSYARRIFRRRFNKSCGRSDSRSVKPEDCPKVPANTTSDGANVNPTSSRVEEDRSNPSMDFTVSVEKEPKRSEVEVNLSTVKFTQVTLERVRLPTGVNRRFTCLICRSITDGDLRLCVGCKHLRKEKVCSCGNKKIKDVYGITVCCLSPRFNPIYE
jgi:hypothetical protein